MDLNEITTTLFIGGNGTVIALNAVGLSFKTGSLVSLHNESTAGLMIFYIKVHESNFGARDFSNTDVIVTITHEYVTFSTHFSHQVVRYCTFAFDEDGYTYYKLVTA